MSTNCRWCGEQLLAALAWRYPDRWPWLRRTWPPRAACIGALLDRGRLKHSLIAALGEARLVREAGYHGFRQNAHLLGVYGFGGSAQINSARLSAWCQRAGDHDLLMCYPAAGADRHDIIAAARCNEYAVLRSEWGLPNCWPRMRRR